MDLLQTRTQKIQELREKFLDMNHKELLHDDGPSSTHWVYFIVNKSNQMLYVGKCKNIYDRASTYIRAWLNNDPKYTQRPMARAITENGLLAFRMFPVARCKSDWDACVWESQLIKSLDTVNPEKGYNVRSDIDFHPKPSHPTHHTIEAKMMKGKIMLCVHPELKVTYVAIGMKIFGDMLGISKDLVKNCAKRPCLCRGFHIYYLNKEDREALYNARLNRHNFTPSKEVHREQYLELYEYVTKFAETMDPKIFIDIGYEIYFLTYNQDPASRESYEICPIEEFIDFVNEH